MTVHCGYNTTAVSVLALVTLLQHSRQLLHLTELLQLHVERTDLLPQSLVLALNGGCSENSDE